MLIRNLIHRAGSRGIVLYSCIIALSLTLSPETVNAGPDNHTDSRRFDLSKEKVLYCIGYAHLDTQWRWDFTTTVDHYIRNTLEDNFERFAKYPDYVFNFTGSVRYEMMKEYYPDLYACLKDFVRDNRWHVSGSSVDEGDANVPSAEAIIRQVLYGNQFFRNEFGKESLDYMLPDCFGFPASMPSIWAHCGLLGFSTQKLTWGSAVGIPFKIGVWEGPDGESVIAALDPGPYVGAIEGRVDLNGEWAQRIERNGSEYGVWADYHYYGVGDQGGAPKDPDVLNYTQSMDNPDSLFTVALTSSDQMYKDITPQQAAGLPRYKGDLLLTEHSAGTLTSQSYMKRWNRKNEILADAAERAAVLANWLGGAPYPTEKLHRSWVRLLANQMHDILPGTSIPRAYRYSWNDEIVASNGFAAVLTDSVGAISRALDTKVRGIPLVVYNPLALEREDPVEATVQFAGGAPRGVRVFDTGGQEVASQILERTDDSLRILFVADVPPVSWSVYEVRRDNKEFGEHLGLSVSQSEVQNRYFRVRVNEAGDIASIVDKRHGDRELLAEPARLVFTKERPRTFPAWNMDWKDRQQPPKGFVEGPSLLRIVERGPLRVALEVTRETDNSIFTQQIRLSAGDAGQRIEIVSDIDWQSAGVALRAAFPFTVAAPEATYNWGLGTIRRGNNEPTKYEVPSHEWLDLTDASGEYGVSVLDDSKYGSDKPSDNEIRLTLLYTPQVRHSYMDQHSQDWGRHDIVYALYPHVGDWRAAGSEWQGRRINQPLRVFQAQKSAGALGRQFSLLSVSTPQVDVRVVKRAESEDEIIVRLQELWGQSVEGVTLSFAAPIEEASEVDGQERRIADVTVVDGHLVLDMTPFSPRSFAVRLGDPPAQLEPPESQAVALAFDSDVASTDFEPWDGSMDDAGRTMPAEMLPGTIVSEGLTFTLGPTTDGQANALSCRGQTIALPPGRHERAYVLAAASQGDPASHLQAGSRVQLFSVQHWTGFVGQWDDRVWDREFGEVDYHCEGQVVDITPGYIKRDPIAWFCTHRHDPERGNEPYQFSYLFKYGIDLPDGAKAVTLPYQPQIKIFAMSVADSHNDVVTPAAPLYDDFSDREPVTFRYVYPPPPPPVYAGAQASADVLIARKPTFQELSMGPPVSTDFADASSGNNLVFRFYAIDEDHNPRPAAAVVNDTLPWLNDGQTAENSDDTRRCVWFDDCRGRIIATLPAARAISKINTYSWHRSNRAPQHFSVWGSTSESLPDPGFNKPPANDWVLLAVVNTKELGDGEVHGSSIVPTSGHKDLGRYRHLLWVTENEGYGTFFTEIDIYVAK